MVAEARKTSIYNTVPRRRRKCGDEDGLSGSGFDLRTFRSRRSVLGRIERNDGAVREVALRDARGR